MISRTQGEGAIAAGAAAFQRLRSRASALSYEQMRNRPVLLLGKVIFFFLAFSLALPLTIKNTQQFTITYVGLCVGYTLLATLVSRAFVRPVFPIAIMFGMQIWLVIAFLLVAPHVVPYPLLGRHLYWPVLVVLPYFVLGSIIILDPKWRHTALKILFYLALINAVIGIFQFLRIPGFASIQTFYSPKALGYDWFGDQPHLYRAVGLTLHPYHLAAQCLFGMAVIGSNLLERRLKQIEIFSFVIFLTALFVAQSRAYYASGAIALAVLLVLLFRRDKALFIWSVTLMAVAGIAVLGLFNDRLGYGIRGKNIAESGRLERWANSAAIVREYPLTGIGPNPDIFGNNPLVVPGKRQQEYTENGYRMVASTMGLPGLALLLAGLIGTFLLSVSVATKRYQDALQRRMGLVGALYTISIAVALNITNMFEHELLTFFGVAVAAICLPDVGKAFSTWRTRRKLGHGFANFQGQAVPAPPPEPTSVS
jgi:O-antigen ligase